MQAVTKPIIIIGAVCAFFLIFSENILAAQSGTDRLQTFKARASLPFSVQRDGQAILNDRIDNWRFQQAKAEACIKAYSGIGQLTRRRQKQKVIYVGSCECSREYSSAICTVRYRITSP